MTDKRTDNAQREEEILQFWEANDIFNKSVERDAPNGDYIFYDGPPFATGTPHYGHLVASAIKDAVPRYWTMREFRVERQWGWDCHGLPLENIVEKELNISGRKEILELGVKKFNDICRAKIAEVSGEWAKLMPRFGRWANMDTAYRTMDVTFMESEWWMFKQLFDKGLVYEDYRSIHICPRCETTLSQSEVTEGYKDIKDLAVTVEFPLKDEENTAMLAWTTTPWTLPGNVALAVGKGIDYVTVEKKDEGEGNLVRFILAKEALERTFGEDEYKIVAEMKGSELVGKEYIPPFDSCVNDETLENRENGWKVYAADFITTDTGTGIAHEAPAFGAEDMELAHEFNLPFIQHLGMDGIIKPEVKELAGLNVKPIDDHQSTDVAIIKYLAKRGVLFAKEKYEHSYPHCWRCDTPLLNYATGSWFVAVEKMKDKLLSYAEEINWSPSHMKKGRWGNWLEGARDWSISRQRFWANTIPVWRCEKCDKEDVFGSIAELKEKSGVEVTDLHKDVVDEVVYSCECEGEMHRIPDVLDTWFNSGSVPFASYHYPFENKEKVEMRIPADFIAEGTDQTRAWFYYQHVLVGGVFEKPAFKNVIVNGMVMAEDGKKMSKKLKNYPDPTLMLDTYGADAMRLYMLSSPVVRAEDFNFTEKEVAQVASKVMGRLVNVNSFYELYKDDIEHEPVSDSTNILDQWIIARMQQTHAEVTKAMDAYELDRATRPLGEFVDDLSTWYIRRSRDRLKSEDAADKKAALCTIRWVLRKYAKVSAPFTPFIADWLWLKTKRDEDSESVHLANWCGVKEANTRILENMERVRGVVSAALEKRAEANIKVRQPLAKLISSIAIGDEYRELVKDEINVKEVAHDESLKEMVELDTEITSELKEEGEVRELIRSIQAARKESGLSPGDSATATISGSAQTLTLVDKFAEELKVQTLVVVTKGTEQKELR
ncbi:MAG: isoleucine--tRNA ligase, partial [Candidatus Pacebacteria bacterium]|nr:isoleucine--tRNA ligase [Candidatus Paceibacterota bacterium]